MEIDNRIITLSDMEIINNTTELDNIYLPALRGLSAYQIAVLNGYIGTEQEWLASLKGEQGVSPIVEITQEDNETTITITDIQGEHTATIDGYDDTEVRGLIADKVDKVTGKGLSTEDYTTSEKTKLSGIETGAEVNTIESISVNGTTQTIDANKNVDITTPTKVSDLNNDSGFITNAVNDLINYYTKTQTYTQAEVNSLINAITTINILVVQTLPTQDISTTTIYLVPKTTSSQNDSYDEFIYVSNNWEHIGSTEVDLTGYATETWVNTQISNFLTQTQIQTLINNSIATKQDTLVSGTNIKTINNNSLLGSGNITIEENEVFVGNEQDVPEDTKLFVDSNELANLGSEVVNSLSGNEETKAPSVKAIKEILVAPNAGAHNSIYRGKDITDLFYDGTLSEQIANGTFDDIFIGDYIIGENSGRKYLVADIDYSLYTGDTETTTHHILMIPEKVLGTAKMNDTNSTSGAYVGSKMYTEYLAPFKTIINNDFGSNHILNHRTLLANTMTNDYESAIGWYDSTIDLMNENMILGQNSLHNTKHGISFPMGNITVDNYQLSIFKLDRTAKIARDDNGNRITWWLRDTAQSGYFSRLPNDGSLGQGPASNSHGVRPAFLVY